VSVEDKGGHACSTCFAGVNAQGTRLHQSFKNAKQVFITDNNISVGKDKGIEAITDINLVISERGKNKVTEEYPSLNAEIFEEVRDGMIEKLGSMKPDDFTSYDIIPVPINESYKFRDDIDTNSIVWNWGNKG
jgi:hypothetical protein